MTLFAWPGGRRGSRGAGQVTVTSFQVPPDSMPFWEQRLADSGVVREPVSDRFGAPALVFYDPDGLKLELVAAESATGLPAWEDGPIDAQHAIRGFHAVTLTVRRPEKTERVLTEQMGFSREGTEGDRTRLVAGEPSHPGRHVELLPSDEGMGNIAAGTVHHVAFRAADDDAQLAFRAGLIDAGLHVTDVRERHYFRSIYFREPSGVLFEIATDGPGFPVDEPVESLGSELKLPDWLEPQRERIAEALPPVQVRAEVAG
jgi:glyoxalase family protein